MALGSGSEELGVGETSPNCRGCFSFVPGWPEHDRECGAEGHRNIRRQDLRLEWPATEPSQAPGEMTTAARQTFNVKTAIMR